MSYVNGLDVSQWQGAIDWGAVSAAGYEIAAIKVSGGDAGLYIDSRCGINYNAARNAGLAVGTYHFAGGGDPVAEADYFLRVVAPLDENQVLILDWEIQHADPVGWVGQFVQHVHDSCGVWPIVYMNGSTANAYSWNGNASVANCGKWIAWYGMDPNNDLPVNEIYIAHQYTSTGSVPGIGGNVDLDAWYIDVPTFNKYGYHASPPPPPAPAPEPAPAAAPPPAPEPTPEPAPQPTPPTPTPQPPTPQPTPAVEPITPPPSQEPVVAPNENWWELLWDWIKRLLGLK